MPDGHTKSTPGGTDFFLGNRWGHVVKFSGIVFFFLGGPTGTQRLDRFAYISIAKMLFSLEVWALIF